MVQMNGISPGVQCTCARYGHAELEDEVERIKLEVDKMRLKAMSAKVKLVEMKCQYEDDSDVD